MRAGLVGGGGAAMPVRQSNENFAPRTTNPKPEGVSIK